MSYWQDKGTPVEKLNMGFATYGRTFQLSTQSDNLGAPISGPAAGGTFTREAGILSYYEVSTFFNTGSCSEHVVALVFKQSYLNSFFFFRYAHSFKVPQSIGSRINKFHLL